jgi:hypothetical protein
MVADYNPALGYAGFQEYQGSPREEIIDGEPRVFRTYYGPAANRDGFLRYMFGSTAIIVPPRVPANCIVTCTGPKTYPRENWSCSVVAFPPFEQLVQHEYFMEPFAYRCEAWDSERAHSTAKPINPSPTIDTIGDQSDDLVPNIDCGVLIEIEYRVTLLAWPPNVHDPAFSSTVNDDKPEYLPDVPQISRPTSVVMSHEYAIEARTLKGRHLEVVSYGSAADSYPSIAAGESVNSFASDDIEPYTTINIHTFNITMRNVPYLVDYDEVRHIMGHVNNDVWFGYPAHAVYCSEVSPKPKYGVDGRVYYDVEYTFIARWVPAKGEEAGQVTPALGPNTGRFIYDDKVGIWNRAWWSFPIPGTKNHWWPTIRAGLSSPEGNTAYDDEHMLVPPINFHLGFNWWEHVCAEEDLDE